MRSQVQRDGVDVHVSRVEREHRFGDGQRCIHDKYIHVYSVRVVGWKCVKG